MYLIFLIALFVLLLDVSGSQLNENLNRLLYVTEDTPDGGQKEESRAVVKESEVTGASSQDFNPSDRERPKGPYSEEASKEDVLDALSKIYKEGDRN